MRQPQSGGGPEAVQPAGRLPPLLEGLMIFSAFRVGRVLAGCQFVIVSRRVSSCGSQAQRGALLSVCFGFSAPLPWVALQHALSGSL
mmetsp:Transcript_26048/g.55468  ORF Transcript_26048/g.55468 Transcript_26048/m.55468 type:complete len:87 (-) Transcript_26048:10-270(-)